MVVVVMVTSASPQAQSVLETDVSLRCIVNTVRDRHHGNRRDGGADRPVTAHQRTWGGDAGAQMTEPSLNWNSLDKLNFTRYNIFDDLKMSHMEPCPNKLYPNKQL